MAQKKIPYLRVVEPPEDPKEVKKKVRRLHKEKVKDILAIVILAALAVCGTYLLLKNQTYDRARSASSYTNDISDTNSYVQFAGGIVRYNRDGVVFLNRRNEEQWIQSTQIQNPIVEVKDEAFAVADRGGNSILVFTEDGLKGEIETTLPIERIAVSEQGIVSAILRNENSPRILTYDAAGNILVEQQVTMSSMGYPVALDLSDDGNTLAVSYLYTEGTNMGSRVIYYNFGEAGQSKADNTVMSEEYSGTIAADIFFIGSDRSVVVGDNSFTIYRGLEAPEKENEVTLNREISSVFYSDRYIGFILLNEEKSGYEVSLYDRTGGQVMRREIPGEYNHVKIDGDEIIMYDGSRCCIMTDTGIMKFQGNLNAEALEMFKAPGLNRYYVMSVDELKVIYLTN